MPITIAGYQFKGPYQFDLANLILKNKSGVYCILCSPDGEEYNIIDVGESSDVRSRIENHDRKDCWIRRCAPSSLYVAVYYTPYNRQQIEQIIRQQYSPPCGER